MNIGTFLSRCVKMKTPSDAKQIWGDMVASAKGDRQTAWTNASYCVGYINDGNERTRIMNLLKEFNPNRA